MNTDNKLAYGIGFGAGLGCAAGVIYSFFGGNAILGIAAGVILGVVIGILLANS